MHGTEVQTTVRPEAEVVSGHLTAIEAMLKDHEVYRRGCLNMIASENITSPAVTRLLVNDLSHRYGDYTGIDPLARKYCGNRHVARIEQYVTGLARRLFGAEYVDLRPLSGHVAGAAVLLALCRPGDTVLEVDGPGGGHRLAEKLARARLIDLHVAPLPLTPTGLRLDVARCRDAIRRIRPRVVVLGSSSFLYPHPVSAIRETLDETGDACLLYDASHVLGLIAGGRFQRPLQEGAHVVVASTHKTFGGPQGGLVLTNDRTLAERIGEAIYPALVTNHHLHRLPALGAACLEWLEFGPQHAGAVVRNAMTLARCLAKEGLEVPRDGICPTESHTVLVSARGLGRARELAHALEEAGLIAGPAALSDAWGRSGLRFGVQELTRRGMTAPDARDIARIVADVLLGRRDARQCRADTRLVAQRLDRCLFALT